VYLFDLFLRRRLVIITSWPDIAAWLALRLGFLHSSRRVAKKTPRIQNRQIVKRQTSEVTSRHILVSVASTLRYALLYTRLLFVRSCIIAPSAASQEFVDRSLEPHSCAHSVGLQ
jgi:hypothetical protein